MCCSPLPFSLHLSKWYCGVAAPHCEWGSNAAERRHTSQRWPGLDVGAIFLWDVLSKYTFNYFGGYNPFVFQTDIHKSCDLKQDTVTRTCLPPPSINDKRKRKKGIHKMFLPLQSSLNRSNSIWRADRTSCSLHTSSYFCCTASPQSDMLSYVTGCSDLNPLRGWIR